MSGNPSETNTDSAFWVFLMVAICFFAGLLAMPSGRDAVSCCRRDFSNSSSSFELSDRPDPSYDTQWSADVSLTVTSPDAYEEINLTMTYTEKIMIYKVIIMRLKSLKI